MESDSDEGNKQCQHSGQNKRPQRNAHPAGKVFLDDPDQFGIKSSRIYTLLQEDISIEIGPEPFFTDTLIESHERANEIEMERRVLWDILCYSFNEEVCRQGLKREISQPPYPFEVCIHFVIEVFICCDQVSAFIIRHSQITRTIGGKIKGFRKSYYFRIKK